MSLLDKIKEFRKQKYSPPKDAKIGQGTNIVKTEKSKMVSKVIKRKIPVRYLVAHKKCGVCSGTGNISVRENDLIPCMCRKIKKARSPKWSRRYWNVIAIYEEKEIKQTIQVPEEQDREDKKPGDINPMANPA